MGLLGLMAGVLASASAAAQTAPAPTPEPATPEAAPDVPAPTTEPEPKIQLTKKPKMDLTTPPPAGPEGREYHVHDGFSLRFDFGLGYLLSANSAADGFPDVGTHGLTFDYDLQIGGAPSPGITLGGAIIGKFQLSGDWEVDDINVGGGNLNSIVVGPFFDGYPNASGNLHFGGSVGVARLGADTGGEDSLSAIGVGGAFWAGSGVWVAPDWSIGGALRLDAAWGKDGDTTLSQVGLSLMFSLLYN